jgi:hypothetical protein
MNVDKFLSGKALDLPPVTGWTMRYLSSMDEETMTPAGAWVKGYGRLLYAAHPTRLGRCCQLIEP